MGQAPAGRLPGRLILSEPTPPGGRSNMKALGLLCDGLLALHSLRRRSPLKRLGAMKLQTAYWPPGGVDLSAS
jgi:hypothetical protein